MTTRSFLTLALATFGLTISAESSGTEIALRQPISIQPWAPKNTAVKQARPIPSPVLEEEPVWLQPTAERPFSRRPSTAKAPREALPMVEVDNNAALGEISVSPPRTGPLRRIQNSVRDARRSMPLPIFRSAANDADSSRRVR